jgi:hypothetical protein
MTDSLPEPAVAEKRNRIRTIFLHPVRAPGIVRFHPPARIPPVRTPPNSARRRPSR